MTNMIREKIEKTFEKTLATALNSPAAAKAQETVTKAQEKVASAKQTLDQVLLGLEHKGYNVKEPQDLIQTVGRKVLERASVVAAELATEVAAKAEDVRSQVAAKPYSPAWLKDLKIPKMNFAEHLGVTKKAEAPVGATEAEVGERLESLEDSPEEKAAGAVVDASPAAKKSKKPSKAAKSEATH